MCVVIPFGIAIQRLKKNFDIIPFTHVKILRKNFDIISFIHVKRSLNIKEEKLAKNVMQMEASALNICLLN
jgi:hypothetical protein